MSDWRLPVKPDCAFMGWIRAADTLRLKVTAAAMTMAMNSTIQPATTPAMTEARERGLGGGIVGSKTPEVQLANELADVGKTRDRDTISTSPGN